MTHPNYKTVKGWLESKQIREMITGSLPQYIEPDAWINSALTHIGSDKDVLEADPESTLGAVLEAATLGVRFEGPLGEAYLEARSSKYKDDSGKWAWRKLTQLQVQYRGLMKLARRDPLVRKVEAIIIYENDSFDHRLGSDQYLHHTWNVRKPRGAMVAVYAALRYHDEFYDFGQPYPMTAVFKHRERILADKYIRIETGSDGVERFYKTWDQNEGEKLLTPKQIRKIPWITYIEAMAQKTAVRWAAKFWDLSPDFDRAAALISMVESGRSQGLEKLARSVVPASALDGTEGKGQNGVEGQQGSDGVQQASILGMGNLKERMLAESGHGQGDMEGAPSEDQQPETEKKLDEKKPAKKKATGKKPETNGPPTPEEQKEIADRERHEAEEWPKDEDDEGAVDSTE